MLAPDSVDWFRQPLHLEGRTMALSKQERHAWNELERVLADDLPYTDATPCSYRSITPSSPTTVH